MSSESPDPTRELLRRLSPMPQPTEAAARVRSRCHAALVGRAASQVRYDRTSTRRRQLIHAVLVLSMAVYLVTALGEALRVVGSL